MKSTLVFIINTSKQAWAAGKLAKHWHEHLVQARHAAFAVVSSGELDYKYHGGLRVAGFSTWGGLKVMTAPGGGCFMFLGGVLGS